MPTYQYACTTCDDRLEIVQKFTDEPLTSCAACGGRLRKVFSPVGVVFKGSGFYRTDSRSASNGSSAQSNGQGSKDGQQEASGSTNTDSSGTSSSSGSDGSGSDGSGSSSGDSGAATSSSATGSSGSKNSDQKA